MTRPSPAPVHLDTNVLLRFLTGEPPALAARARRLMQDAENGKVRLRVCTVVVAEAVWVLGSFYGHGAAKIAATLSSFLMSDGLDVASRDLVVAALRLMAARDVDFVGALIAEEARAGGEAVASFDGDFKKLGVARHEV